MSFVNLHAHTEASIADGLFGPKKWVEGLKMQGYKAHAVTDHGVMTNLLPFYKLMKEEKMTPIMGCEFYFVDDPTDKTAANRKSSHIILLAKDYDGFRNMLKLSKLSFTEGFYFKNRIGLEWLKKYGEGLVCLTACQGGVLAKEVWNEVKGRAGVGLEKRFDELHDIFNGDLYVEFQGHVTKSKDDILGEYDSQAMINKALYDRLKDKVGFKPIITNDCHYILKEHAPIQGLIKNISWKSENTAAGESSTVTQNHSCDSLWLKKPIDVFKSFNEDHDYLPKPFVVNGMLNTQEVLDKCSGFTMPTGKRYLPTFRAKLNSADVFKKLTFKMLKDFLKANPELKPAGRKAYIDRFKKEYEVITKYGLEDYFSIVWDLIRFANSRRIYTGIGRGSAAGCFISYLLGIVKIDPLKYNLLFERFLNEHRCEGGEMPDIDLDFESNHRNEIKAYIYRTYGEDKVCEIGTYGRMKLRTSLIDFGKAMGVANQKELLAITTKIDLEKEDADSLEKAAEADPRLMKLLEDNHEYAFAVEEIIGQIKSQGVHPAGVVICSEAISDITPVKTQKNNKEGKERILTTQAKDEHIIAQGLMKVDILGLKEYDVIRYVIENAPGVPFERDNYVQEIMKKKDDPKVWKMFQEGRTEGVFQFASDGMKGLLIEMKPTVINDLIAANALYRPGCLDNGWHLDYCRRKNGEEAVEFVHPDMEKALGETYGVLVYQEQFMEAIHLLGGISLVESDTIRSALGKKDKKKLEKFRERFVKGATGKIGEDKSNEFWEQIEKAAGYTFNKSHSAAYSELAFISQYLKTYWPAYFWAAQLEWDTLKNKADDMLIDRRAASDMGVEYLLPDINLSKRQFQVHHGRVVWSLSGVTKVGPKAAAEIELKQPYASFEDFHKRVNKSRVKYDVIQNLIFAGAFDHFGDRRDILRQLCHLTKGKKYASLSEEQMMLKFHAAVGFFEQKLKTVKPGFSSKCITEKELHDVEAGGEVKVGGMITDVRVIKTKKGDAMAFVTLMDLDEIIDVTVFPQAFGAFKHL